MMLPDVRESLPVVAEISAPSQVRRCENRLDPRRGARLANVQEFDGWKCRLQANWTAIILCWRLLE
jgi:hypothetical protein